LTGEWIGFDPQVINFQVVFLAELIAALDDRPVTGAVSNDADFGLAGVHFGARNELARGFKLMIEALHVIGVVVRPLAILRFLIMAAAAREVSGARMVGPRKSAIADAIAVHVLVAGKSAETIEVFLAQ